MLRQVKLADETVLQCLYSSYGLDAISLEKLSLGADFSTVVYRAKSKEGRGYFVKLRTGGFSEASLALPNYFVDQGIQAVIAPLATQKGELYARLSGAVSIKMILYPYIEARSAAESKLTQEQWVSLGTTLKHLHSLDIPSTLKQGIPRETFSAQWREALKAILLRVETEAFKDAIALKVVDMLQSKSKLIVKLLRCAESLAISLQKKPMDYVLCHADLHGWNLLIDEREQLYIVDWDTLLFAPKERDVMFVGAAIWDSGHPVAVEEALFYKGYGGDSVDMDAITYYRCERILQDICEYCQAIFSESQEEADKLQSFNYLQSNFLAGGTVEQAFRTY